MKFYNDFNSMFQAQSGLKKDMSVFNKVVDDGEKKKRFILNRSYYGLYIPAGLWREMTNFSTNSLALEFGSIHYDRTDYVEDYEQFLKLKSNGEI